MAGSEEKAGTTGARCAPISRPHRRKVKVRRCRGLLPSPLWGGVGGEGRAKWHRPCPTARPPPPPLPPKRGGGPPGCPSFTSPPSPAPPPPPPTGGDMGSI